MKLILQMVAGSLGLWLAIKYVPGVEFNGEMQYLILAGCLLGIINFFLKPVLKIISTPLRMLTFGLFGIIINMLMVWAVDIVFIELIIPGIIPLFWTTMVVWAISTVLKIFSPKKS